MNYKILITAIHCRNVIIKLITYTHLYVHCNKVEVVQHQLFINIMSAKTKKTIHTSNYKSTLTLLMKNYGSMICTLYILQYAKRHLPGLSNVHFQMLRLVSEKFVNVKLNESILHYNVNYLK